MATTLILGASDNPERYANKAQKQLLSHGHQVILINPKGGTINGIECLTSLEQVKTPIDTVTIYIRPEILEPQKQFVVQLKPRRIIFNPGTESKQLQDFFAQNGIEVIEACTLVLLSLGTY